LKDEEAMDWRGGFLQLPWDKEKAQGGVLKSLEERSFWVSYSCVIFLGKGRRGMRSFGRWWKGESGLDV